MDQFIYKFAAELFGLIIAALGASVGLLYRLIVRSVEKRFDRVERDIEELNKLVTTMRIKIASGKKEAKKPSGKAKAS